MNVFRNIYSVELFLKRGIADLINNYIEDIQFLNTGILAWRWLNKEPKHVVEGKNI